MLGQVLALRTVIGQRVDGRSEILLLLLAGAVGVMGSGAVTCRHLEDTMNNHSEALTATRIGDDAGSHSFLPAGRAAGCRHVAGVAVGLSLTLGKQQGPGWSWNRHDSSPGSGV